MFRIALGGATVESFPLFNRMRKCLGRDEIRPPKFDGAGNPVADLTTGYRCWLRMAR
jgi:hypothetical protein